MNGRDFNKLMATHGIKGEKTVEAMRLVLVDGLTAYEAAAKTGVSQALLSRAKKRAARPLCACCGQPLPD